MKRRLPTLDLHGVEHSLAEYTIEKFLTNNFRNMPVLVITGNSAWFWEKLKQISDKYHLGCYPEKPGIAAAWIIFTHQWKKTLDNQV